MNAHQRRVMKRRMRRRGYVSVKCTMEFACTYRCGGRHWVIPVQLYGYTAKRTPVQVKLEGQP